MNSAPTVRRPELAEQAPTRPELVARATALRGLLTEEDAAADLERRLRDRCVDAVRAAGLFRLMTPNRFGGYESDLGTLLEVTTEIGRGSGSAAWVAGVLNAGNFMAALFPERAQHDVWGENPDATTALMLVAPKAEVRAADGGVVVDGAWGFSSGALHSGWCALLVPGDDPAVRSGVRIALVPSAELSVRDTWFVAGMRGTGSTTMVAEDVFIPEHRIMPYLPAVGGELGVQHPDNPLYRSIGSGVLLVSLLGSLLGCADAALAYVLATAPNRAITSSTYAKQTDSVPFQLAVGDAAMIIDTAHLVMANVADTVDRYARDGALPDVPTRTRFRAVAAHAAKTCREAVQILMSAHGTAAFADAGPLQRWWRDISVGSHHAGFNLDVTREMYGKALIGVDPRAVSYLL